MGDFQSFLESIDDVDKKERMELILNHISEKYPQLNKEIKWSQPMFSDHGTFIIGFSIAKQHIAVGPEAVVLDHFDKEIERAGYERTKQTLKLKWTDDVDFPLLEKMIDFNIEDKKDMTKYWR